MSDLPVQVYSPEPLLSHPLKMIRDMLAGFSAGRELAWRLFTRDISAQFRQTILGYLWFFLPPIVSAMTFVFLRSQGVVQIEDSAIPYAAFAMMGTLLWQVFVDALQSPLREIAKAKKMLAKVNFPREAIILTSFYLVFFNFAVRLTILIAVMLWWKIVPGAGLVWFLPAICSLVACGMAIGMTLVPFGSLFGDFARAVPIVAQFWMLLTPVVYPPKTSGLAGWLAIWNPVSPLIVTARETLTGQPFTMLPAFLWVSMLSILLLLAASLAYRIAMPHIIARMGS